MESFIVVRANDRVVKVTARNDGTINEKTLRRAFQLEDDVPIGLFKNDLALACRDDDVFELQEGWKGAEFELRWEESRRKLKKLGATNPKKRKIEPESQELPVDGDLAASIGRYALYYNVKKDNYKRSAIPLTPRLAATFRHGDNKSIEIGDEIVIRSWSDEKLKVSTRAVKIVEELDTIILESDGADLCHKDLISNSILPRKGMQYLMMGYSILHEKTSHQSLSTGIIVSDVTRRLRYTGSSGSFKGDSGGSCWNENGQLIGMQIEVQKRPHTQDEKGRPASPASGGRCCIVAIISILANIQDLLPPADSDGEYEWNE
ncbi:unnamed protein product [Caenorhabditis sp. 36 PRJEB53466]|nr:unnamed protein product [Caenorhabditis sp. 36 PRJEB53466]